MYLYVDDSIITFSHQATERQVTQVFHELWHFSAVSGLQQKVSKSACVTKCTLQREVMQLRSTSGLQHDTKVRYLGVKMRDVYAKETFVGP